MVLACADSEPDTYSIFSPEAFVQKDYTPFFYDNEYWYYGKSVETDEINSRFNNEVITDWDNYLNHKLDTGTLQYLFFKCDRKNIDSVFTMLNNKVPDTLTTKINKLNTANINTLFNYLKLAKSCEQFAVGEYHGWYDGPTPQPAAPKVLEAPLSSAFNNAKEPFVKQRLWFQLIRYYFFCDTAKQQPINDNTKILAVFHKYQSTFPQNLIWYRALGYIAGYYKRAGEYAQANYLYSRCYDYSFELKIPSKFSFHPQEEDDWDKTLKLAKNKEERITLWHLLGMEYDPVRAIREIVAIDPKSDKVDLLLSRVVNMRENGDERNYLFNPHADEGSSLDTGSIEGNEIKLVDSIALKNNTAKPYFWNIAAGYLHYMQGQYKQTEMFYARAKKQLPVKDTLVMAQYKMLSILLYVNELKHIDSKTETKLVEPLNWLKNVHMPYLRVGSCSGEIAKVFLAQGDSLKADCFTDTIITYNDVWVQRMLNLINKPNKTSFEKTMVRYYPRTANELYYHQALKLVYREDINGAITIVKKTTNINNYDLPANPFTIHINDCHDCDQAVKQKKKYNTLTFLNTIQNMRLALNAGTNRYQNALLLANAFYNISYYGNNRSFYDDAIPNDHPIYSQQIAKKYYLLALKYAQTSEQKAKCTFMLSKCEHNKYYTDNGLGTTYNYEENTEIPPPGKYFAQLKKHYNNTAYYREVLQECGYFRKFVNDKSK